MSTIHIESKKEDIASRVLMPGDPNRVKYIVEKYLTDYKLVNERRGELAYTGYYKNELVTIFSSGMGIPSMGIYSYELFKDYDVKVILRIGTARSVRENINIGDLIFVDSSFSNSCYSMELLGEKIDKVDSSEVVNGMLIARKRDIKGVKAYCAEAFYEREVDTTGFDVIEMESYSLFLNAMHLEKYAGCLLTITDKDNLSLDPIKREKNLDEMIVLALESIIKL